MKHLKLFEEHTKFTNVKHAKVGDIVVCIKDVYKKQDDEYFTSPHYGRKYKILNFNGNFMTVKDIENGEEKINWSWRYFVTPEEWEIIKIKKDIDKYNI